MDQRGGGDESDREALLAGRQAKTEGNVGLAGTTVAERDIEYASILRTVLRSNPNRRAASRWLKPSR